MMMIQMLPGCKVSSIYIPAEYAPSSLAPPIGVITFAVKQVKCVVSFKLQIRYPIRQTCIVRLQPIEGRKANAEVPFTLLQVDKPLKEFWEDYFKV